MFIAIRLTQTDIANLLPDLLFDFGEDLVNYADVIENELEYILDTEFRLEETIDGNNGTASIIRKFGTEVEKNADDISAAFLYDYNQTAVMLIHNTNNITSQVDREINSFENSPSNFGDRYIPDNITEKIQGDHQINEKFNLLETLSALDSGIISVTNSSILYPINHN